MMSMSFVHYQRPPNREGERVKHSVAQSTPNNIMISRTHTRFTGPPKRSTPNTVNYVPPCRAVVKWKRQTNISTPHSLLSFCWPARHGHDHNVITNEAIQPRVQRYTINGLPPSVRFGNDYQIHKTEGEGWGSGGHPGRAGGAHRIKHNNPGRAWCHHTAGEGRELGAWYAAATLTQAYSIALSQKGLEEYFTLYLNFKALIWKWNKLIQNIDKQINVNEWFVYFHNLLLLLLFVVDLGGLWVVKGGEGFEHHHHHHPRWPCSSIIIGER